MDLEQRLERRRNTVADRTLAVLYGGRPPVDASPEDQLLGQLELLATMAGTLAVVSVERFRREVARARQLGATWRDVAAALGLSMAAVKGRYGAGLTYDQRRRAERAGR